MTQNLETDTRCTYVLDDTSGGMMTTRERAWHACARVRARVRVLGQRALV